jgi:hypothetical protein
MASNTLTPADPRDLADAPAHALRFQGGKRVHNAEEIMVPGLSLRGSWSTSIAPDSS